MHTTPALGTYPVYSVAGDRYTYLLTGAETGGAYFVFEAFVPPGGGPPLHVHHREDEAFYVIDGLFEFTVNGTTTRVGAGEFVIARREVPHCFKSVGTTAGRMIITVTPAGMEHFFAEIGVALPSREHSPVPPSPADIAKLKQTAPRYGIDLLIAH